jgi:hypothetical protein
MFLIGQKGKIPQLFVFKKPIVVERLKNFGRMNGEIHIFSTVGDKGITVNYNRFYFTVRQ